MVSELTFLHTSDWHLGQRLYGKSREEEHALFLDWLLDTIAQNQVDLLIVSGDIFDVGFPSNKALESYYNFLHRLKSTCCENVVITGGNHDYASTLNSSREILNYLNIYVFGGAAAKHDKCIVPIFKNGNKIAEVGAVPYLRDGDIRISEEAQSLEEKALAVRQGIAGYYSKVADAFTQDEALLKIMCGHLFLHGGKLTGSERDIQIGNLAGVHMDELPKHIDYWALGHIHRPQIVAGDENVRYSGSPIPMDFSEKSHTKSVVIGTWRDGKLAHQLCEVPMFRKLVFIKGTLAEVQLQLNAIESDDELKQWCELKVEEEDYSSAVMLEFRNVIHQNGVVEIIKSSINFRNSPNSRVKAEEMKDPEQMQPEDVFKKIISVQSEVEQKELLSSFYELRNWFENKKQEEN